MRPGNQCLTGLLLMILLSANTQLQSQEARILNLDSYFFISPLLDEISGMCYYDGDIYALNDGGNGAYIFKLDPETGELKEKYRFRNIRNRDWEELSVYNGYLYIGDFGNNRGKRTDLAIYRVKIDSLQYPEPPFALTRMEYLAQGNKKTTKKENEWDCEAMTVTGAGIYCFSKNRKDMITRMYHITENTYNYLSPADSFDAGFLVTGAYFYSGGNSLFLCGYNKKETYLLRFEVNGEPGFSGEYTRYILPELKATQVESVFVQGEYLYLASEKNSVHQAIYRIRMADLE
jgi:hypothetical protein